MSADSGRPVVLNVPADFQWREVEATVFFITHSIEEAVFLGDRVGCIAYTENRRNRAENFLAHDTLGRLGLDNHSRFVVITALPRPLASDRKTSALAGRAVHIVTDPLELRL